MFVIHSFLEGFAASFSSFLHLMELIHDCHRIWNYFEKNQGLDDVGGVEYLVRLTRFSSSVKQAIDYAKIVHENFVKRELIQISNQIKDTLMKSFSNNKWLMSKKIIFYLMKKFIPISTA